MADEPSIDEILASLDRLLKEGDGRNDEPEAEAPPAADEPSPSQHDAPTPHFFAVLDEEVEAGHVAEPAEPPQADAAPGGESAAEPSRLFVLTDAMMVDDQPSLPLGMGDAADAAMREALAMPEAAEPQPAAPEPEPADAEDADAEPEPAPAAAPDVAPAWDESDVQALVDQITDDVCSAMAEQLPEMIRMALAVRLGAFIDAHTKHQDTGTQE
jgi:hypothetical protein